VIPAVISSDLIDMYNTGFAKANDLPQLTVQILNGQRATLIVGSSSFNPSTSAGVRRVPITIVGVSDRVPLVGVSLPLSTVNGWNRDLVDQESPTYIQLNVVAKRAQDVDEIAASWSLPVLGSPMRQPYRSWSVATRSAFFGRLALAATIFGCSFSPRRRCSDW
jgi:hypothetical protein